MHNAEKDARGMAEKRQKLIEAGFALFVDRSIDAVSLETVAKASGVGVATLYRYFGNKVELAVAISEWQWREYLNTRAQGRNMGNWTGAQIFAYYLDGFLDLFRSHRELLRYNQLFNIFVRGAGADDTALAPFTRVIDGLAKRFEYCWQLGASDGTLRTDTPWQQAFSTTLHIMLAAVTRYAVGLVYNAGIDPETELILLRDMLMKQYAD